MDRLDSPPTTTVTAAYAHTHTHTHTHTNPIVLHLHYVYTLFILSRGKMALGSFQDKQLTADWARTHVVHGWLPSTRIDELVHVTYCICTYAVQQLQCVYTKTCAHSHTRSQANVIYTSMQMSVRLCSSHNVNICSRCTEVSFSWCAGRKQQHLWAFSAHLEASLSCLAC